MNQLPSKPTSRLFARTLRLLPLAALAFTPQASWPALLALTLVLSTRNAAFGLAVGALSASLIAAEWQWGTAFKTFTTKHFFGAFEGAWHIAALLFTLILGSFAALVEHSGGFQSLINRLTKGNRHRHKLQLGTLCTGLLCFFDGLANALLLGRLYRPLYDQVGISREKLAYLVDTTSSAIACIAFISTWIATQLSLIEAATATQAGAPAPYLLFLHSIPFCFYCTSSLILAFGTVIFDWNPGHMAHCESQAAKQVTRPSISEAAPASASWRALIPIAILVVSIPTLFYLWETRPLLPVNLTKFQTAFSGPAGPYALTLGAAIGCLAAWICQPRNKRAEAPSVISRGAASMLSPLLILVLAWTFGSSLQALGTAELIASLLSNGLQTNWLPAAVFACAAVTSFMTGSSWGTMSLFMPLALPVFFQISAAESLAPETTWQLAPAVIGAIFGGAVFGDHCSPFSDTTIVSAIAAGTPASSHVRTQLPYALSAAMISLLAGYVMVAIEMPIAAALVTTSGISLGLPWLGAKASRVKSSRSQ